MVNTMQHKVHSELCISVITITASAVKRQNDKRTSTLSSKMLLLNEFEFLYFVCEQMGTPITSFEIGIGAKLLG